MGAVLQLTAEQIQVVQHSQGHAKVTAVAGAGKTTTLAQFIRQRLLEGANPRRMMVIMYNKSAQVDFTRKLNQTLNGQAAPQVRTFHSLGLKIYQRLVEQGLLPSIQGDIISQSEEEYMVWKCMQECASSPLAQEILNDKKKWLDPMMSYIERVKSCLEPPKVVYKQMSLPKVCDFFPRCFEAFEQWRKDRGRITYSDMLYDPCCLFSNRPDLAVGFANHMDWILVDEYQDINPIQQFLLTTLAGVRASVMVIGDPDQTIYEFRGSSSDFMRRHFDEAFSPTTHYELSHTFRYGHDVALLSNQLVSQNPDRTPVLAVAHDGNPNTKVTLSFYDDYGDQVLRILTSQSSSEMNQTAILLRIWGMSAPIELALLKENIPYQMPHSGWVLERYELQNFMMLLELAAGVFFDRSTRKQYLAWLQFLTFPALKIKRGDLEDLAQALAEAGDQAFYALSKMTFPNMSAWQKQQVESRLRICKWVNEPRLKAHQLFNRYIRETDFYKGISDSAFSKAQVDDRVMTVQGFTRFIATLNILASDAFDYLTTLKERHQNQVQGQGPLITSIHRSKGLEWPTVIIPGLTDRFYPYENEGDFQEASSIEGERRLLYVAMTRAQSALYLLAPRDSGQQGVSPMLESIKVPQLLKVMKSVEASENSLALPKVLHSLVKQYATKVGWSLELKSVQPVKPKVGQQNIEQTRLHHAVFGSGVLSRETDRHWHVMFDDGQSRVLDKQIAAPHIIWG